MNKTIIFLLALLTLSGCASNSLEEDKESINDTNKRNENWCWFQDSDSGQGYWVKVGKFNTVKNGNYTMFYAKGEIREKGLLENGKNKDTTFFFDTQNNLIKYSFKISDTLRSEFPIDGSHKFQFPEYNLYEEGEVKGKKRTGEWITYYKSGKIERKAQFLNGKLNGNYKEYSKNGILIENSHWKNSVLNGLFITYFESGQIKKKSNWISGNLNGQHNNWFENGNLNSTSNYVNGEREGEYQLYREDGSLNQKGVFLNGIRHGELKFYNEKGVLFQVDLYDNGELINIKEVN